MQKLDIWSKLIQEMIDTIKHTKQNYSRYIKEKIRLEGELLSLVLDNPDWYSKDYVKKLRLQNLDLRDFYIIDALKRTDLFSFKKRKLWVESIFSVTERLKELVMEKSDVDSIEQTINATSSFLMVQKISDHQYGGGIRRKAFLIWLCRSLIKDFPQLEQASVLLEKVKRLSFKDTKVVTLILFRGLAAHFEMDTQFYEWEAVSILEEEFERKDLSDAYDSLSDYLEWIDAIVKIERNEFEKQKQRIPDQNVKSFFSQMNSVIKGRPLNLLDVTVSYLKAPENQSQIEKFNADIKEMIPIVLELHDFLTALGLERFREEGEQFSINFDEAVDYEYNGSPFTVKENMKQVKVIGPGWKYRDVGIVSRPEVIEKKT